MSRELFHQSAKGTMGEKEDWFYIVRQADGRLCIEHEWDYVRLSKLSAEPDRGSKRVTIEAFLASDAPAAAKGKLRELLSGHNA
ncbi:MAG: hypothetical protein AAFR23_02370 [Pseudomonadota bacterium]